MMLERCKNEIEDLHQFFVAWFSGKMDATSDTFARLERALDADFTIVTPAGKLMSRKDIIESVRSGHGSRPDLQIWIENVAIRRTTTDSVVTTYEEWQKESGEPRGLVGSGQASHEPRGRLSSVVFSVVDDRLTWLHVHETWIATNS